MKERYNLKNEYKKVKNFWNKAYLNGKGGFLAVSKKCHKNRFNYEMNIIMSLLNTSRKINCEKFLDIGCGEGEYLIALSRCFKSGKGVDSSQKAIELAKRNIKNSKVANVVVEVCDLLNICEHNKYDVIFVGGVLMYISDDDLQIAIDKLKNLLRDDGVIILRESVATYKKFKRKNPPTIYRYWRDLINLFEKRQFLCVKYIENEGYSLSYYFGFLEKWRLSHLYPLLKHLFRIRLWYIMQVKKKNYNTNYFYLMKKAAD